MLPQVAIEPRYQQRLQQLSESLKDLRPDQLQETINHSRDQMIYLTALLEAAHNLQAQRQGG